MRLIMLKLIPVLHCISLRIRNSILLPTSLTSIRRFTGPVDGNVASHMTVAVGVVFCIRVLRRAEEFGEESHEENAQTGHASADHANVYFDR